MVFWPSAAIFVYVFLLFPLLMAILAGRRQQPTTQGGDPRAVTVIVPFFNEKKRLGKKLDNCLGIEYPADRIDFLFVSDGSTDGGDKLVTACDDPRVRLLRLPENQGKAAAMNAGAATATGELILFTDAGSLIGQTAPKAALPHLHDPRVGCVCGIYRNEMHGKWNAWKASSAYLGVEMRLRTWESATWTAVGGTGALLALRKKDYTPLPKGVLNDDFVLTARQAAAGNRVIYEPGAVAVASTPPDVSKALRRRARISCGNWQMLSCLPKLPEWRSRFAAWVFISHKLLRMILPIPIFALWAGLGILAPVLFCVLTASFAVLLLLAGLGLRLNSRLIESNPLGIVPLLLLNFFAICQGTLQHLRRRSVEW